MNASIPKIYAVTQTHRLTSGALFRLDPVEGRPALLDVAAAAVRAEDFPFLVINERQDS